MKYGDAIANFSVYKWSYTYCDMTSMCYTSSNWKFTTFNFLVYLCGFTCGMLLFLRCRYGWALTWALYKGVYTTRTNACEDPRRLLDPYVLVWQFIFCTNKSLSQIMWFGVVCYICNAHRHLRANIFRVRFFCLFKAQGNIRTNASISPAYTNSFAELWSEASEQWDFTGRNGDNQSQWRNFVNETTTPGVENALLFTFTSRECSDADNCLGVAYSSGTCVCYVTNVTD